MYFSRSHRRALNSNKVQAENLQTKALGELLPKPDLLNTLFTYPYFCG